jgi:hypothetical protein
MERIGPILIKFIYLKRILNNKNIPPLARLIPIKMLKESRAHQLNRPINPNRSKIPETKYCFRVNKNPLSKKVAIYTIKMGSKDLFKATALISNKKVKRKIF